MNTTTRITFEQVFNTPVGTEMDALIRDVLQGPFLLYSTDDRTALEVVAWLWKQKFLVVVKWIPEGFIFQAGNDGPELPDWRCVCELMYMPLATPEEAQRRIHLSPIGSGATMAEAVCRATLKAVHDWFAFSNP